MKQLIKFTTLFSLATISLTTLTPSVVSASVHQNKPTVRQEEIVIKNSDIYHLAKGLYNQGLISKKDFSIIQSSYFERWGPKGETKVVKRGDGQIDLYLNNWLSNLLVGGGAGAAGVIILQYPPVALFLAQHSISGGALTGALGSVATALTNADSGLILTLRVISGNGPLYNPTVAVTNIRDQ